MPASMPAEKPKYREIMRYLKIAAMVIASPVAMAGFMSALLFPLLLVSLL